MSRLISIALIDPSPWADLFPHDEEHVSRLAEDVAARGVQTPIHVYPTGGRFELLAGHDRLEAAKRAGKPEIAADFRSTLSSEEDRFEYFLKDNTLRKDVDRRAVAKAVLLRHPTWSDRRVGEAAGVSHPTVAAARAELVEVGRLESVSSRESADGRTRPATQPERPKVPGPEEVKRYREKHGLQATAPEEERPAAAPASGEIPQSSEPEPETPTATEPATAQPETMEPEAPAREKKPPRERKPKPAAPAPAAEKEDFGDSLATELEHAHKEIERLEVLVSSLSKSDLAQEVRDWALKFDQLNGRLQQAVTTGNEAAKDATRRGRTLADIRKELGVERDSEILPALRALRARQAA